MKSNNFVISSSTVSSVSSSLLASCGGKGKNLIILAKNDIPVPPFVILTTDAFFSHIVENNLNDLVASSSSTKASAIRKAIVDAKMPQAVAEAVNNVRALATLTKGKKVAVRSSATAEDLPSSSFAGQHDTYLNIDPSNEKEVHDAIKNCWASLFTDRAVEYRSHNNIHSSKVKLAVVIQEMVDARAAGVLFTANPFNGSRKESIIDSTLGLGEKLVSGEIIPDHFVVSNSTMEIVEQNLVNDDASLTHDELKELIQLGQKILKINWCDDDGDDDDQSDDDFLPPQDIEFAVDPSTRKVFIVQSRSITTLPRPPKMPIDFTPAERKKLQVYMSFAHHQGLMDPLTPMGIDIFAIFLSALTCYVSGKPISDRIEEKSGYLLTPSGARGWECVTNVASSPLPFEKMLRSMDVGASEAITFLKATEPELSGFQFSSVFRTAYIALLSIWRAFFVIITFIVWPQEAHRHREKVRLLLKSFLDKPHLRLIEFLTQLIPKMFTCILPTFFVASMFLNICKFLAPTKDLADGVDPLRSAGRNNPTTDMAKELWSLGRSHRETLLSPSFSSEAGQKRLKEDPDALRTWLSEHPKLAMDLSLFLSMYGHRGSIEIDCGRPRFSDQPFEVLSIAFGFAQLDENTAETSGPPHHAKIAAKSVSNWLKEAQAHSSSLRYRVLSFSLHWALEFLGYREVPKFFLLHVVAGARAELLKKGPEMVKKGLIEETGDVFFLRFSELSYEKCEDDRHVRIMKARIAQRKEEYEREGSRKQLPSLMLSDGRFFYSSFKYRRPGEAEEEEEEEEEGVLRGQGVSIGEWEGTCVVLDKPDMSAMKKGDILVCRGTDPSWGALFSLAGGLVSELGGFLTHAAIVSREMNLPAVVGVPHVTTKLKTGMRVHVNGTTGKVKIIGQEVKT